MNKTIITVKINFMYLYLTELILNSQWGSVSLQDVYKENESSKKDSFHSNKQKLNQIILLMRRFDVGIWFITNNNEFHC